jgi:DEAD/DEAH box helicase domain-containing protein
VACLLLMSDPHDLGMVAQVRSPHAERPVLYLWESVPGGVGLAPRLFERTGELLDGALALVEGCGCEIGCPACVGPRGETGGSARTLAVRLLRQLGATERGSGIGEASRLEGAVAGAVAASGDAAPAAA